MSGVASEPSREPAWAAALFAAAVLLAAALHLIFFHAPPYVDEGDFANTGRILLRGGAMYRDAFNEKGPGIYWLTAGLFAAFGDRFGVVRGAAFAANLATLGALWAAGVRLRRRRAAALAALLFAAALIFLQGTFWRPESLLTPLLLAVFALLAGETDARRAAAAGVAVFAATLIKQTAWAPAAAIAALFALDAARRRGPAIWAFAGGLCLPWAAVLAAEAARGGLGIFLAGYLFPVTGFVAGSYAHLPRPEQFFQQLPIWWTIAAAWLIAWRSSLDQHDKRLWTAVLAGLVLMTLPAFFTYHFLPALALAAFGLALPATEPAAPRLRRLAAVAAAGLVATIFIAARFDPLLDVREHLRPAGNRAMFEAAAAARAVSAPGEPIFVLPHNSLYYYLADRRAPGRYGFVLPWVTPPAAVREVVAAMQAQPPKAILYNYFEFCMTNGIRPKEYLAPLLAWIADRYRVERLFANRVVLLVPADPQSPTAENDRRAVRALLFSDLDCRGVDAGRIAQLLK